MRMAALVRFSGGASFHFGPPPPAPRRLPPPSNLHREAGTFRRLKLEDLDKDSKSECYNPVKDVVYENK